MSRCCISLSQGLFIPYPFRLSNLALKFFHIFIFNRTQRRFWSLYSSSWLLDKNTCKHMLLPKYFSRASTPHLRIRACPSSPCLRGQFLRMNHFRSKCFLSVKHWQFSLHSFTRYQNILCLSNIPSGFGQSCWRLSVRLFSLVCAQPPPALPLFSLFLTNVR